MGCRKEIKIVNWKIEGLTNTRSVGSYMGEFDIVLLQEAWLEKGNERERVEKLNKRFNWVSKVAERIKQKGSAKGGSYIGIR